MADIKHIQWVPITSIKPWIGNPRKNDEAAKTLSELIKIHGCQSAITVWRKNNVVYKGNTTLKAMKLLGRTTIPVSFTDFKDEAAAVAYGLSDNKAGEYADWDDTFLAKLLTNKEVLKSGTGFTNKEVLGITWQANLERLNKIEETSEGLLAKVTILCQPKDKADVLALLKEWSNDCGFENLQIDS
jgi:hypothetical protein